MRTPESLSALVDDGIIDEVLRPLMSGKEAQIYLVLSNGEPRVAKIYKDAQNRSFQNRADYTEGRTVRNSRDQRAMGNRSRHGRAQNEAAWKSAEVDMIYRLRAAGVRVPTPYHFIDGVLIMELITDAEGFPAPRLGDLNLQPEEASAVFETLLKEVVRMLCAGVVHGDLSDFNVLMSADGPVIIDLPQAVDAASNHNARKLLLRDVANLHRFHAKLAPEKPALPYAEEMWELYQHSALTPDTRLRGTFRKANKPVRTDAVLGLISDADKDERRRRERLGLSLRGTSDGGSRGTSDGGSRVDPRASQNVSRRDGGSSQNGWRDGRASQSGSRADGRALQNDSRADGRTAQSGSRVDPRASQNGSRADGRTSQSGSRPDPRASQNGARADGRTSQSGSRPDPRASRSGSRTDPRASQSGSRPDRRTSQSGSRPDPRASQSGSRVDPRASQSGSRMDSRSSQENHAWPSDEQHRSGPAKAGK